MRRISKIPLFRDCPSAKGWRSYAGQIVSASPNFFTLRQPDSNLNSPRQGHVIPPRDQKVPLLRSSCDSRRHRHDPGTRLARTGRPPTLPASDGFRRQLLPVRPKSHRKSASTRALIHSGPNCVPLVPPQNISASANRHPRITITITLQVRPLGLEPRTY